MLDRPLLLAFTTAAVLALQAPPGGALEPTPNDRVLPQGEAAAAEPAQAPDTTDRIIVTYRPATEAEQINTSEEVNASFGRQLEGVQLERLEPRGDTSQVLVLESPVSLEQAQRIAEDLARDPRVLFAEPDAVQVVQQANDTRFMEQWHYSQPGVGIDLPAAWQSATGDGVVIAVLDTGICLPHEELAAHTLPGFDFVSDVTRSNDGDGRDNNATDPGDWCEQRGTASSWHGTHVAGTIAAITNNNLGVAGIATGAKILPVRVLGKCGGMLSDIADGILWAAGLPVAGVPDNPNPAKVLNLSLGGPGGCGPTYTDAIRRARENGATVVVSAGNADVDAAQYRPASCDGVITVAATNREGGRSYFGRPGAGSNFGATVEIAAPGGETYAVPANGVLSTINAGLTSATSDDYAFYQGTSMAAPHVAGVVGLMYGARPAINPDEVVRILQQTSQPFPSVISRPCDTNTCGAGILDAGAAIENVTAQAAAKAQ